MSQNESAGGSNARNDGGKAVTEQYESDSDNTTVEYRVKDQSVPIPETHKNRIGNRYKGPKEDIPLDRLAGQGAIEILDDGSHTDVNLTGPAEPVVHDDGSIQVIIPNQAKRVNLGVWRHSCGTVNENPPQNGEVSPPNECEGCDKQGSWEHEGELSPAQVQAAVRAGDMWYPPGDHAKEGYSDLWDDVRAFIRDHWDAKEPEIYNGLTAYALSTWLRPNLTFVPHLMLMGKTTGGKTRLLNTLARVSYRAVVAASATPASMFRMIDAYDVSYFVSEYHGLGPDEQRELDNVVRAGQKEGEIVTRAEQSHTGFEPKVFDPFSHIAIATQYTPEDDIVNRCIQVRSSPENRDMPATLDDTRAKEIRNRLLYARFRLLNSNEWEEAEHRAYGYLEANNITGRTREKLLSLITVAILWDELDSFEPFINAVCEHDQEAVANSEDARFVQVLRDLALEEIEETTILTDGDPFAAVAVPYTDIVDQYEDVCGVEKSASWVGHIRDRLDFEKERKRDGTVIQDPELGSKLQQLCEEHNLKWESSDSAEADPQPSNPGGSVDTRRLKTRIKDKLKEERYGPGATASPDEVAELVGAGEENTRTALDDLATETRLLEKTDSGYRVLRGGL
ncbi:hypothetical protein J2751_001713 [Halorubrum alkaliphilum]|uniref:Uncharacterized protein n=1 Tax=Halorubrum alkaliphilum TaxID=261290 RepID=A0A8T4GG40_9EURY|nr:hypothetical protein [Halorubrum alkaliphilum]MBP1922699.1 hypothetical protein [Halorubrum alkaliphilum]